MGTINYRTSDYITLAIKPYDADDFAKDNELMDELRQNVAEYGGTIEEELDQYVSDCYNCDRENIDFILGKYDFYYYHVIVVPGYYEGFSIEIESNFPVAFDSWEDRRECQKEITQLKKCLIECAGRGIVSCVPGWCTAYGDCKSTLKNISVAIAKMREEVRRTPTWRQYEKEGATA